MTTQEHKLMMIVFAKQLQMNKIILEILKSRGIAVADDAHAFEFSVTEDDQASAAVLQTAKKFYLQTAESLGIETGLKDS